MKKYYKVNFATTQEVLEGYGGLLSPYARQVIHSILSMDKAQLIEELSKIPKDKVEDFYKSSRRIFVYVDELTNRKWRAIPFIYKKQAQYLLTLKLSEKLRQLDKEGSLWK